MKKFLFAFTILTNFVLAQGPACNVSSMVPTKIFYAGVSTNLTYTWYPQYYLCVNATVYDTVNTGDSEIFIESGATYYWRGGTSGPSKIWIKSGGTLNLIASGNPSSRIVYLEPGSTIIDPSNLMAMSGGTVACSFITPPTVNCFAGINEINKYNIVSKIYPNPSNGSFKLQIDPEIKNGELILMNSLGQKNHDQKITQGENDINTNGLAKGLYHYVLLENKEQISTGKIAIE